MRTEPLAADPQIDPSKYRFGESPWSAKWVGPETYTPDGTGVWAFQLKFDRGTAGVQRVHVSADQRYHLYLNGKRIGRGAERSDLRHWMYDSYDLALPAGKNVLVAIVWWCSPTSPTPPPWAQQTQRPGFMAMADGEAGKAFCTGVADWQIREIDAIRFDAEGLQSWHDEVIGYRLLLDGSRYPWGIERGAADGFVPARVLHGTMVVALHAEAAPYWTLRPSLLPAMREEIHQGAAVRHVESVSSADTASLAVDQSHHVAAEAEGWNKLVSASGSVTVPANSQRRVIVDLNDYINSYTELATTGGAGATVRVRWAESLFVPGTNEGMQYATGRKGNRSEIQGRFFRGYGDTFTTDGGASRAFETLWWKAGRYVEIYVQTKDQPLTIDRLSLVKRDYPYDFVGSFTASDERLEKVIPLGLRTLQRCSFETNMDCPYYEQLNYTGDTRLQSLVAMTFGRDDRLARKALHLFDWSRGGDTWSFSRAPTRITQTINTFCLWYVAMIRDYALYRGDMDLVRTLMPGARALIERWRTQIDDTGLVRLPDGWNFVDWVGGWYGGSPNAPGQACGVIQWQMVYMLNMVADLETMLNEPLLAQRHIQTAAALAATAERTFFNPARGLLADDVGQTCFSEHAQVLALLSGHLSQNLRSQVAKGILEENDLKKTSIYFSFYTFEALGELGRTDKLVERMKVWYEHFDLGMYTLLEQPEPSRSDCHAWGAHPLHHYFATILGIRPASFGFATVSVTPQLGALAWAQGEMVHPKGVIKARFEQKNGMVVGEITLPEGVSGEFSREGQILQLKPGINRIG